MLDLLQPFFRGDWAQYGESLRLIHPSLVRTNVAQWLADPTHLTTALTRHAEFLGAAREPRAVASDWVLRYLIKLLPPIVALASLLKYSVPTSSQEMALTLNEFGAPAVFSISQLGTARRDADTAVRYNALVWQHLAPLIAHIARQTKVPSTILWGNARRTLLDIFGQALPLVNSSSTPAAALIDDRRQLLESPTWCDGRRNPLFLRHRQVAISHPGNIQLLTLHANCCLAYQLPGTGHCGACPLAPQYHKRHFPRRSTSQ